MAELIDEFKYRAYLGKLEKLKSQGKTKKPIVDFIKELYILSNEFSITDSNYNEQPQTLKYVFKLVGKALLYYEGKSIIRSEILQDYDRIPFKIIYNNFVKPEDVQDLLEFYTGKLYFSISKIKEIQTYSSIMDYLEEDQFVVGSITAENLPFRTYSRENKILTYLYIRENLPNSKLLNYIKDNIKDETSTQFKEAIKGLKESYEAQQSILQGVSNEHYSGCSEEHY